MRSERTREKEFSCIIKEINAIHNSLVVMEISAFRCAICECAESNWVFKVVGEEWPRGWCGGRSHVYDYSWKNYYDLCGGFVWGRWVILREKLLVCNQIEFSEISFVKKLFGTECCSMTRDDSHTSQLGPRLFQEVCSIGKANKLLQ